MGGGYDIYIKKSFGFNFLSYEEIHPYDLNDSSTFEKDLSYPKLKKVPPSKVR